MIILRLVVLVEEQLRFSGELLQPSNFGLSSMMRLLKFGISPMTVVSRIHNLD
jgi:hypothetical protein